MKKCLCIILSLFLLLGCTPQPSPLKGIEEQNQLAAHSPFEPYGETIEYTLAKLTGLNNMPRGDTYENNAITRYLKQKLNIQNKNVLEAQGDEYQNSIDMYISSQQLPDVMIVQDYGTLQYLVENDMIEDLTTAYQECTTQRIKNIFKSYGTWLTDFVTFDGKIMALPETNIINGPQLVWLRKDWMDQLGLKDPQTLDDVENIVEQFVRKDPGKNGKGKTIGLMIGTEMTAGMADQAKYLLDPIFAKYGAYPKQWYKDQNGKLVYGSTTQEAKKALEHIHELYQKGIIDRHFFLRTSTNIAEEIVEGRCGSFFGPWWASNNPLIEAVKKNPDAKWESYLIPTQDDGKTVYYRQSPSTKFVVVRKGYEHPEIIFKMISVQFDYLRYIEKNNNEINQYEKNNVDQTARPLAINIDYEDALKKSHYHIKNIIAGKENENTVSSLDNAYANACLEYLNGNTQAENWAAYASRIKALSLFDNNNIVAKKSLFYGHTDTMNKKWWKLKEIEKQAYIEFIIGERDLSEFSLFVEKWENEGGKKILKEIQKKVK